MNLARALLSVPRDIRTTPGLQSIREPAPTKLPIQQKAPSIKPAGLVEATAIIWYIGQISHTPATWSSIQRWVQETYGIAYHPESIRHAVTRYGIPRKNRPRRLPEHIMRACMQHVIVLRLHGHHTPWHEVRDRLWIKYKINETNRSISNVIMSWAGVRGRKK